MNQMTNHHQVDLKESPFENENPRRNLERQESLVKKVTVKKVTVLVKSKLKLHLITASMVAMEELMICRPNNPTLLAIDPDTSKNIGILAKHTHTMNPNGNRKLNYYIFEI